MRTSRFFSIFTNALTVLVLSVCAVCSWAVEKVVDPINVSAFEVQLADARTVKVPATAGRVIPTATGASVARDYSAMLKDVNSRMPGISCPKNRCK